MNEVYLRQIDLKDTKKIVVWRNKPEVRENLFSQEELTESKHIQYYNENILTGKCRQYVISVQTKNKRVDEIGTVFIKNLDFNNKKGELGIFIGENEARGKGFAKLAIRDMLTIAFQQLELNKVYLSVLSNNEYAIKAYCAVGFHEEGRLRQDYCRDGIFMDVLVMSILKEEWLVEGEKFWGGGY